MTGMLFEGDGESLNFVAVDGFKLVEITNPITSVEIKVIVPKKQLNLLKSNLSIGIDVDVVVSDKNISFLFNDFTIIGRIIDERFPDYRNAIPKNEKYLELDKLILIQSLKRISLFSNKTTNLVKFAITENQLVISSQDLDYNHKGDESFDITSMHELNIGLNAKTLLELLQNVKGDVITMAFSEPNRAVLITGSASNELFLTMPVMLNV
jgi:DNA polymerase-3 subunit beta